MLPAGGRRNMLCPTMGFDPTIGAKHRGMRGVDTP
jgi:hypothetical protein